MAKVGARTALQMADMLLGRKLGHGVGRTVYECRLDRRMVVKLEERGGSYQNIIEWEAWKILKDEDAGRWLAPCVSMSANGSVLIQHRTYPVSRGAYPKRMPVFLGDYKYGNYGALPDGRFVAHDYGSLTNLGNGIFSGAMRAARWWDE